jgi:hypothetical protein
MITEDEMQLTFPEPDDDLKHPSDAFIQDVFGYHDGLRTTKDPMMLEIFYQLERAVNWVRAHGTPTETTAEMLEDEWRDELDAMMPVPTLSTGAQEIYDRHELVEIGSETWTAQGDRDFWDEIAQRESNKDPLCGEFHNRRAIELNRLRQVHRWAWERKRFLSWEWVFFRVSKEPPDWVLKNLGLVIDDSEQRLRDSGTRLRDFPSIVKDETIRISSNLVLTGAMNGIHSRFPTTMADRRPAHIYKTRSNTISFLLDDPQKGGRFEYAPASDDVMATLLKHQSGFSALDVDVLLAIDAQILLSGQDKAWIGARAILEYRGIKPKRSSLDKRWTAGARMWGIEDIASSVDRIDSIYVQMGTITDKSQGQGRKPYLAHESKLVRIDERIIQHTLKGTALAVEWLCRHGTWREEIPAHLRDNTAHILQTVLQYDPYHEPWEKKIGQYLGMHQRIGAHNVRPLERKIRTILDRVDLPEGGISTDKPIKHPERTIKAPFEKAIDRLCKDGVIADCSYPDISLPARGWLNSWAEQVITFTPTTRTSQQYLGITAQAQDQRNRAAIAADARKNRVKRTEKGSANGDREEQ